MGLSHRASAASLLVRRILEEPSHAIVVLAALFDTLTRKGPVKMFREVAGFDGAA